jgi:hypothetical protein
VDVIKNIVNVIKMGANAILLVDVLDARIQKMLLMEKKLEKIMNVVQRIVFIYLKIKFIKNINYIPKNLTKEEEIIRNNKKKYFYSNPKKEKILSI